MITLPVIVYMALSAYLIYLAVTAAVSKSEDLMVQKIRRFVTIFISAAVLLFILAAAGSLWHIGLMPRECAVMGMSILGVDINWQKVVKGLVLLAAVIFDVVSKKKNS